MAGWTDGVHLLHKHIRVMVDVCAWHIFTSGRHNAMAKVVRFGLLAEQVIDAIDNALVWKTCA
jgi:hypothetical protein